MTDTNEMDYNVPSPTTEEQAMALSEEERKKSRVKASVKYDKANTFMASFKLNYTTDADIIKHLESIPNRQGYIKDLIRRDIAEGTRIDSEST